MAIKLTTQYLSENEFLYDVAQSTGKFDTAMYEQQKELGASEQYTQLIAGTLTTEPKTAFDDVFYNKLSSEDKLAYITQTYYTDVESDQYKKNEEYFKQKEQEIKNKEIYEGLSGFEKAAATTVGWVGTTLNSVLGIAEGVVDFLAIAAGQLAQLSGIPLITGKTEEVSNAMKEFIAKDITGYAGVQKALNNYNQAYTFIDKNGLAKGINDIAANLGQYATVFIPVVGPALFWSSIAGNTAEQNIHSNPDIDWSTLMLSTGLTVGVEGLTEYLGGKLFPDDIISSKLFGANGTGTAATLIKKVGINFLSEGLEEGVAEFLDGLVYASLVTGDEKDVASIKDILYASLIGGIMGAGATTITTLATTPKYSVVNGELVETATLSKEEKKLAKNLGFRGSYELISQIDRTQQVLQQPTAVASLMTKYGTSLSDIRKNHAQEYQDAVEKDIAIDEKKTDMVLDLSNLLQTIGIDQFVKSAELLNESVDKAREMVDNFLNHTDVLNKQASAVFSKQFPDQTFTPQQTTSQEQVVTEGLRKVFPQYKFVFGKYGSKNGQPIRQINVNDKNKYVFIESGLVDKLGVEQTISRVVKQHIAQDVMTRIDKFPDNKTDALVALITDKAVKYKDLTEAQKRTIAQIICFDPIKNKKVFNQSKQVHQDVFNYITKQAGFIRNFGVRNKTNQIRYRDLMKIRENFMNAISRTVYSKADIQAVRNNYNLTEDELNNKIVFKTRPTILNKNSQLMNLDMTEQGNAKHTAMQMLLDSRLDTTVDFDWNRLYDFTYYTTDFVNSLMQNEKNMALFEPLLREYINNQFNTDLDLNDRDSLILFINNNMTPQEIQKSAQIVLTDDFVQANKDTVLNSELGSMLYTLSGKENVVTEQDGVILTDNQIKGTGKLKFFKGDVYERFDILGTKQDRANSESARKELQRNPRENRTYNTEYVSYLTVAVQDENTLEKYQKDIIRATKKAYGMNVKFFKNSPLDRSTNYTMDDVKGFISKSKNTIYIKDDISVDDNVIVTVVRHEITHHLLDVLKTKNNADYVQLIADVKKTVGTNTWNKIRENIKNTYKRESSTTLDEETLVSILNDECSLPDEIDSDALTAAQEKLFKNSEYNDPFVRPSVVKDSSIDDLNRKLTEQQQKYFKDSVVRDILGRLITMYHGTPNGGFTIFDIDQVLYGLFGKGFYHTENPDVGRKYSENRRGNKRQVYEVYMNITNPIDMDAEGNLSEWIKAVPDAEDYFPKTGTNEEFFRALEDYMQDEEMTRDDAGDFVIATLSEMGYDGITHVGGKRVNQNDPYHRVYIAFYPEQIKSVYNTHPTQDVDIMFSRDLSQQTSNETKNIKTTSKATTPKQIADAITSIVDNSPMAYSESKGFEGAEMEYTKVAQSMIDENFSLFRKVNQDNYQQIRDNIAKTDAPYTQQALVIFDRALFTYAEDSSRFDEATQEKIKNQARQTQTISAQWQGLQSRRFADKTSLTEIKNKFAEDGYDISVSNETVTNYVPEMKNKENFIKQIDEDIAKIESQINDAKDSVEKAALNKELKDATEKRMVMDKGTNEEIMDWVITNEDIVNRASKIQKEIFEQMVDKAEKAAETPGKKAITILVDEKTGLPKPFPKATQWIEKNVKRLKSFRMWAMLTSPVSWVRNWVGNAGMTVLDSATNQLEKWMTARLPQIDVAKLEQQAKELNSKKTLTDAEKTKLAEINAQIQQAYDFKFVETTASKELKQQIAQEYKSVFQQILNGEDISKYEGSAEKAGAIARAEREITRKSENANFVQKVWAACQSITDWGLNTGLFGDNAVVLNSLIKNFANMVESNKTYLIKSLTTEYGKDGRGMSAERKALVEKALNTKNSMDIVNAMSKSDVELFMDSCKQRTFEQYFKNSNWLSKWASNLSQKHPILASLTSLVLPFPKVAANIMTMAYKYSPLGFISALRQWSVVKQMDAAGYKGVRDAFARAKLTRTTAQATVGTVMCIAGLILASLGFVDIDDDDYLGPALHMGDLRISLSNLAPSMTTFSVGAAMMWAWKNDQSAALKALDVLYDNTLLGNIENVFRYGDPTKYIENLSINYVSQYVPAMLKLFAKITTNQAMIDKSGSYFEKLGKTFVSGIPFAADLLSKKINPYTGEFLTNTGSQNVFFNIMEAISPLDFKTTTKSKTQKEAERLGTESSGLTGKFKINDKEYDIDKVTYSKYRATYIQNTFDNIMNGKQKVTVEDENGKRITTTYDKLTDKQKKNVLSRLYTEATNITKIKWWTDQGNKYVVTDRDLYNEYRKQFKNIIYKKTWTKSKFVES